MAADIHPPVLTDVIANPLFHSMESFWNEWGVGHSDLNNVLNTWIVMIVLIVAGDSREKQTRDGPQRISKFLGGGRLDAGGHCSSDHGRDKDGRTFR